MQDCTVLNFIFTWNHSTFATSPWPRLFLSQFALLRVQFPAGLCPPLSCLGQARTAKAQTLAGADPARLSAPGALLSKAVTTGLEFLPQGTVLCSEGRSEGLHSSRKRKPPWAEKGQWNHDLNQGCPEWNTSSWPFNTPTFSPLGLYGCFLLKLLFSISSCLSEPTSSCPAPESLLWPSQWARDRPSSLPRQVGYSNNEDTPITVVTRDWAPQCCTQHHNMHIKW